MPGNYLYGPIDSTFATRYLSPLRQSGACLSFGPEAGDGIDLVVAAHAPWTEVEQRLPEGCRPDFLALAMAYTALPSFVAEVPFPVVGLAADWNLLWDAYQLSLPLCDLVLTDAPGVEVLRRAGCAHVEYANLFGGTDTWLPVTPPDAPRDIDVLLVGNLHPAVQRKRLPLVARLAKLAAQHKIVLGTFVAFPDYHALLQRARVVFNPSARLEWNQRVCEAVSCGCLLAIEADNAEILATLRPGQECVTFTPDNLETVLAEILADEPRRQALARAAQEKIGDPTFARFWREAVARIEPQFELLRQQRTARTLPAPAVVRRARSEAQPLASPRDEQLLDEVVVSFQPHASSPAHFNELALLYALETVGNTMGLPAGLEQCVRLFQQALTRWPQQPVLGYNAVRALVLAKQFAPALTLTRQVLNTLDTTALTEASAWDLTLWSIPCDDVWVEWQRAGWLHPSDASARRAARRDVLRWYLHMLEGDLDPRAGVVPYYESVQIRPDLARGQAALGCALARAGNLEAALGHLRAAVTANPFDRAAANALAQLLTDLQRGTELNNFREGRRLLQKAAPGLVPIEEWFAPTPTVAALRPTVQPQQPGTNGVAHPLRNGAATEANGTRPSGRELASLILLCHDQVEVTRDCLESVFRFTREPYELLLINNGSTDATPAFLAEIQNRPGPARVRVITNATNRGFAAGCNQGIADALGRYLVFLNNDTIVTPGWLDGLVALSLRDWPRVGLTGPVTNRAIPEQTLTTAYDNVQGMLQFARARHQSHVGQCRPLDRLSGFCLLARRDVLDQIGNFDEQFGLAYFEDDDLCLRARQAGFQLLVALDVFVHHRGSQTIQALGLDSRQLLQDNLARLATKWGDRLPAGYRNARPTILGTTQQQVEQDATDTLFAGLPGEAEAQRDAVFAEAIVIEAHNTQPRRRTARVTLGIITCNEESNLPACIEPARDLFDDILVNDTGSTDRTVELARALGARVIENPWQENFGLARNQILLAATGDWIFWLDADDRLGPAAIVQLRALFAQLQPGVAGYSMTCRCRCADGTDTDVNHVRLFYRHPDLRWQRRIHEQIVPGIKDLGGPIHYRHDIVIHHTGYADAALRSRKLDRDLRLLQMERAAEGDDPFTLFNLGQIYLERGSYLEAFPLFQTSLQRSDVRSSIVRKLYAQLARCQWELGQRQAAQRYCAEGLRHYPKDDELLFLTAHYHQETGNFELARQLYHELIQGQPEADHFGSTATGLRGYRAMINLGLVYRSLGQPAQAEHWFRAAVTDRPNCPACWAVLAEEVAARSGFAEVANIATQLDNLGFRAEAAAVRGRHLQAQ